VRARPRWSWWSARRNRRIRHDQARGSAFLKE
jgi:hypothetical protein